MNQRSVLPQRKEWLVDDRKLAWVASREAAPAFGWIAGHKMARWGRTARPGRCATGSAESAPYRVPPR
jgi:hypothetical protein